MKNKFRKIKIDNNEYLYFIRTDYYSIGANKLTLTIFLNSHKRTPLFVDFLTLDDYHLGQPLNVGVSLLNLKTNEPVQVNINEPKYIREFILLAFKNGWNGINKIDRQNGLDYLTEIGFEVSPIQPKNLPKWWLENTVFKDVLADATFPIADKLLTEQGTFSPFAAVITEDGSILHLENETREGLPKEEAINNLKKIIKEGIITHQYVGCVIVYTDRVLNYSMNKTMDTVAIYYESTREKKRWTYFYPFRFTPQKKLTYFKNWAAVDAKEVFI